ncbi:MAG TPA: hypothetical protein VFX03_07080, partial [Thermomicrobiales bacterium]|nr:hypothetical protein [Thermomicrobiales bacterium]
MTTSRRPALHRQRFDAGPRLRVLGVAVGAAILIGLVVVASRPVALPTGSVATNPGPALALVHVIEILGIALELLTILVVVVVLRMNRNRKPEDEPEDYHEPVPAPWWLKAIVAAVPVLTVAAIVYAVLHIRPGAPPAQPI